MQCIVCNVLNVFWIFSLTVTRTYGQTSSPFPPECSNLLPINSELNRTSTYIKSPDDPEDCEAEYLIPSWYAFTLGQNILTSPPEVGGCGSSTPIWLNGTYPTSVGEYKTMTACRVTPEGPCQDSWDVTVLNCQSYNIAYLSPVSFCGRYCMDESSSLEDDPCFSFNMIPSDQGRKVDAVLMGEEICDNITEGWHAYSELQNFPTSPPVQGQCSSNHPIWIDGVYPAYWETKDMTACKVGITGICEESWTVPVKNCGPYNVAYLSPLSGCARYCMDNSTEGMLGSSTPPYQPYPGMMMNATDLPFPEMSNDTYFGDPCFYFYAEISDDNRKVGQMLVGEEECDNVTEGWYAFSNFENVPTSPPAPGQCSSNTPIWFDGNYPIEWSIKEMLACKVSTTSDCEESWVVQVKNCSYYNVAYLKPHDGCGRYCMESRTGGSTPYPPFPGMMSSTEAPYPPMPNDTLIGDPCYRFYAEISDDNRKVGQMLVGEEECDNVTEGWYAFSNFENVPTSPPAPGQCSSNTPIWFDGKYPTEWNTKEMLACKVSTTSDCEESWVVQVKNCSNYNVAYLKPHDGCGRYCMESHTGGSTPYPPFPGMMSSTEAPYPPMPNDTSIGDPCYNFYAEISDDNRKVGQMLVGEEECDNVTEGWYAFSNFENVPTSPPAPGQCSSNTPIWFDGKYPTEWNTKEMLACKVSDTSDCDESWVVQVKNCSYYNVAYLKPHDGCGRYCMESRTGGSTPYPPFPGMMSSTEAPYPPMPNDTSIGDPCYNFYAEISDDNRKVGQMLVGEEECDNVTEGWYAFSNFENVPTSPPAPGQCSSNTPIWFDGKYPTEWNTKEMLACKVSDTSDCDESWVVQVKNCSYYNVAYLKPHDGCGRYCIESRTGGSTPYPPFPGIMSSTEAPYPPMPNDTSIGDPCYNFYAEISDDNRKVGQMLVGEEECDNVTEGWYAFSNFENVPTSPPAPGQCSSNTPIWFYGKYPTEWNTKEMLACKVSDTNDCEESWVVQVKNCSYYNVAYLKPHDGCGRYCMESRTGGSTPYPPFPGIMSSTEAPYPPMPNDTSIGDPCYNFYAEISDDNRKVGQMLVGEEECDNVTEGWYAFSNFENVPTSPPAPGQCSSNTPIWFDGKYPAEWNTKEMLACKVSTTSDCEESWVVQVKNCSYYNVAYLKPHDGCGRYCMESRTGGSTPYPPFPGIMSSTEAPYPPMPNDTSIGDPCYNFYAEISDDNRKVGQMLVGEEECDNVTKGWYAFSNFENVPTSPPAPGQCSSNTPIWFDGKYPTEWNTKEMLACKVSDTSDCDESWVVQVKNCSYYNVAYLKPHDGCGRYCMEGPQKMSSTYSPMPNGSQPMSTSYPPMPNGSQPMSTHYPPMPNGSQPMSTPYPPMPNGSQPMSTPHQPMPNGSQPMSTPYPPMQNGSQPMSTPYPPMPNGSQPMSTPHPSYSSTSRFNANDSSFGDPCYNFYAEISDDNRKVDQMLVGEEECDNVIEGWYAFSNFENVPTSPPAQGQCSSNYPIWFDGEYPSVWDTKDMLACKVGNKSNCEESWDVQVKNCSFYNVAYLRPHQGCGRYCMEGSQQMSTPFLPMPNGSQPVSTPYPPMPNGSQPISTPYPSTTSSKGPDTPSTVSTTPGLTDLNGLIGVSCEPFIPTTGTKQLSFRCKATPTGGISLPNDLSVDVQWTIDGDEITVQTDIQLSELTSSSGTRGILQSTSWSTRPKKIGFDVKCGVRVHSTGSSFIESPQFFAGIQVNQSLIRTTSGSEIEVSFKSTVPLACTTTNCKISLGMNTFTHSLTAGQPGYCDLKYTHLKPSMCGLDLDGPSIHNTWQKVKVKLPEHTSGDQESQAKLKLYVESSSDDTLWSGYEMEEVTINVDREPLSEQSWMNYWYYGDCFTGTDPVFWTFDWKWYGFHDAGEFLLWRHKNKPEEVTVIQHRYDPTDVWTEHCAIAIRAGSEVFIIYGCSGRPQRWIVKRIGCSSGNLVIYKQWGSYEVRLPSGTSVYIWKTDNRLLNIYMTLAKSDRQNVEGLCGNNNGIENDDFTGKDGILYDNANSFARTWKVPASESLFRKSSRDAKLAAPSVYCSCSGQTKSEQSSDEYCGWTETMPMCPPYRTAEWPCLGVSKRSTNTNDDDKFDVDIAEEESTIDPMLWKNGWTETSANASCYSYFSSKVLSQSCSEINGVDKDSSMVNCIMNIQVSGTNASSADAFKMFTTQCDKVIRTNNTIWNTSTVARTVKEQICPKDCEVNGVVRGTCSNGICTCNSGYSGDDCSTDDNAAPVVPTGYSSESLIGSTSGLNQDCTLYGTNLVESPYCQVLTAEMSGNDVVATESEGVFTQGTRLDESSVNCPLTTSPSRRKRSTSSSISYYVVSISNDNQTYSTGVPIITYDSTCYDCTATDSSVSCTIRSDVCVVDGVCYSSSHSSCASDDNPSSKAWVAAIVVSLIAIMAIVAFAVYYFKFKHIKRRRPVSPAPPPYEIYPDPFPASSSRQEGMYTETKIPLTDDTEIPMPTYPEQFDPFTKATLTSVPAVDTRRKLSPIDN